MTVRHEAVIIGAGHNGLVAACLLARAGLKPLVLERRQGVGGAAVTDELHPGFRCPTLAHALGPMHPGLARTLALPRHGFEILEPSVRAYAPLPGGGGLTIHADPQQAARELARFSEADGRRYAEFCRSFRAIGRLLRPVLSTTPPAVDHPRAGDLWGMLKLAIGFRRLGRKDAYRLLRWGPMAVADLVAEWFDGEPARALFAARGIWGSFAGPWSAGTGAALLLQAAAGGNPSLPATFVRGGPGSLSNALASAAREAGAEIRTGAPVARVRVHQGRATGVVLADGTEIEARAVVSNLDPKATLLGLIDPIELDPGLLHKVRSIRTTGVVAKVNLALAGLPDFRTPSPGTLAGRIHIGPSIDDLERAFDDAKYGEPSGRPYLDVTIPSVMDPGLAPAGAHVLSANVQFAPYALRHGGWPERRDALGTLVVKTLAEYAPDLPGLVLARQVLTPDQLESDYGLTGGHPFHGEHALDQLFAMRPIYGWARYRTPIAKLYLCGAGTHPGGGVTGTPGVNAAREILANRAG